jgi:hypothetical protein
VPQKPDSNGTTLKKLEMVLFSNHSPFGKDEKIYKEFSENRYAFKICPDLLNWRITIWGERGQLGRARGSQTSATMNNYMEVSVLTQYNPLYSYIIS